MTRELPGPFWPTLDDSVVQGKLCKAICLDEPVKKQVKFAGGTTEAGLYCVDLIVFDCEEAGRWQGPKHDNLPYKASYTVTSLSNQIKSNKVF